MNKRYKSIWVLLLMMICQCLHASENKNANPREELFKNNLEIISSEVDADIQQLKDNITAYKAAGDTLLLIDELHKLARKHIWKLEYVYAYKSTLDALFLSEAVADSLRLSTSYEFLSELNTTYGQSDYALKYLNESISIIKRLISSGSITKDYLVRGYYKAAVGYRNFNEYDVAKSYIDSALLLSNSIMQDTISKCYLYSEIAILHNYDSNFYGGLDILLDIKEYIEKQPRTDPENNMDIDYLVFIYTSIGYSYMGLHDLKASKEFYIKALEYIHDYGVHFSMKPYVLYLLSEVYSKEGNMALAYKTLSTSKDMYDKYYDVRSGQRLRLLEANSAYEGDIRRKNDELYQNSLLLAAKEQKLLKSRILLISITFLVIIGVLFIRSRNQRIKYKYRNEVIKKENMLQDRAAKNLLEVKNKELTTNTLQLIEQDKIIKTILNEISSPDDKKKIKSVINSAQVKKNLWHEFNHRFNSVNSGFYERLNEKFPDLSLTDQKYCALIKLNFSGKEIAHLLGMTITSVHTARSRIRTKMNLSREENLNAFIAGI